MSRAVMMNGQVESRKPFSELSDASKSCAKSVKNSSSSPSPSATSSSSHLGSIRSYCSNAIQVNQFSYQPLQREVCLLHNKVADIVCRSDSRLVCANCALFGEHKNHSIISLDEFTIQIETLAAQTLLKMQALEIATSPNSRQLAKRQLTEQLAKRKNEQVTKIKYFFSEIAASFKKIEKNVIIQTQSAFLEAYNKFSDDKEFLELRKCTEKWHKAAESFLEASSQLAAPNHLETVIREVGQRMFASELVKDGDQLLKTYSLINNKAKRVCLSAFESIKVSFDDQSLNSTLRNLCYVHKNQDLRHFSPVNSKKAGHLRTPVEEEISAIFSKGEDQNLLDTDCKNNPYSLKTLPTAVSILSIYPGWMQQDEMTSNHSGPIINQVPLAASIYQRGGGEESSRKSSWINSSSSRLNLTGKKTMTQVPSSASKRKPTNSAAKKSSSKRSRGNLSPHSCKQDGTDHILFNDGARKKINVPDKFRGVYQDLCNDRTDIVDFGGAELGDQVVCSLSELLRKCKRVRTVKLIRNKLTDYSFRILLQASIQAGVRSLNLSQNAFTERSLQVIQTTPHFGAVEAITLSLNRLNRRSVKERLDELGLRGLTVTI